jgi:hypothetical protein
MLYDGVMPQFNVFKNRLGKDDIKMDFISAGSDAIERIDLTYDGVNFLTFMYAVIDLPFS